MAVEWIVVTVIIALVGLIATIIKPVITLTKSITKLTVVVDNISDTFTEYKLKNNESHSRLWDHNTIQDKLLEEHDDLLKDHTYAIKDHENRINKIEKKTTGD